MDEVFGNSSSETVVSVQDLQKESDLDDPNETSYDNSDSPSNINTQILQADVCSENRDNLSSDHTVAASLTSGANKLSENNQATRVSVITSVGSRPAKVPDDQIFKIPYPPSESLALIRHTQAAVVALPAIESNRQNVQSTAVQVKHCHLYQNLPMTSFAVRPTPTYVNLPRERTTCPHSAPNTPSESDRCVGSRMNSSYIQLWTGVRQKRNLSESDSDDTVDSRISAAGYVKMTSPYVRSPSSSVLSDLAHHLASYSRSGEKEVFCPFCPRPFTHESSLSNHIQAVHRHELQKVICGKEPVLVQHCPLCHARFFNLNLLPSHLLEFHRGTFLSLLDERKFLVIDSTGVKCPFCSKKVPISKVGEDVLLYHLLQLHSVEYENLIHSLFKPVSSQLKEEALTLLSLKDLAQAFAFKPGATSTPGLSIKFQSMSCELETASDASCIKMNETWSSHRVDDNDYSCHEEPALPQTKGILRSDTDLTRKPSVKRELRFSVPPVTSEEVFVPESPESTASQLNIAAEAASDDDDYHVDYFQRQNIPVRVDSLSSADFIELTHEASRKRRKLGIGRKSKRNFKKDKENIQLVENVLDGLKSVGCGKSISGQRVVTTTATRTFKKPKPVPPPRVPDITAAAVTSSTNSQETLPHPTEEGQSAVKKGDGVHTEISPFASMKLYSPLRMFRCNRCRVKFCDNESLGIHIRCRHRGILGFLRPQFGCGICEAKFYENKYLVKHCLQHHTSLLEIRSPNKHKITVYRVSKD